MFPLFTTRCLHVRHDVRDPSGGSGNCGRECCPVILPKWRLPRHLGIFYMPQIYDMGPTALLPLRRKACWGFFSPLKIRRLRPGLNPRTWVLKASTVPIPGYKSEGMFTLYLFSYIFRHDLTLWSLCGIQNAYGFFVWQPYGVGEVYVFPIPSITNARL